MKRRLMTAMVLLLPMVARADLTAVEAVEHVGEEAVVCGMVASAKFAERTHRSPTFLNLDKAYPHQVFTALIWGDDRPDFDPPPERLKGKRICVSGEIRLYKGKAEIIVASPSQIMTGE